MKKMFTLLLASAMALSLTACGDGGEPTPFSGADPSPSESVSPAPAAGSQLGETVSTDLAEFTLDRADLTIALENAHGDDYFLPKEYSAEEDSKNPFVASKGHCLVAITYTLANLNRGNLDLDGSFNGPLFQVSYQGKDYHPERIWYGKRRGGVA